MNHLAVLPILAISMLPPSAASAADWIMRPSYYSHDPQSGHRVTQFAQAAPVFIEVRADYVMSGYRHTESRIEAHGSADYLHVTEEWGRPVRPYGEWQHPFRPYSVPYDLWGPPVVPWASYGPWGYGYAYPGQPGGPGIVGPRDGYDRVPDRPGHEVRPEGEGDRRRNHAHRPFPGDDGYPGEFFGRPTTDHEFFWPRPRDPARRGLPPEKPTEAPAHGDGTD